MSNKRQQSYLQLLKEAYLRIERLESKLSHLEGLESELSQLKSLERALTEPIAIIGMGCRFPGANSPQAFWQLLRNGVDAITEVPAERWDIEAYYDPDPDVPSKMSCRYGGFIDQVDQFDAHFFGISPREAATLDPQQRLLLEVSWEALENANLAPDQLVGSQTGVFIGISTSDYSECLLEQDLTKIDAYIGTGNSHSVASGRLSYFLGLQGPSLAVDTACSASLVAVHLAMTSLRNGESDLALAGGVNLLLSPETTINFSKARMLAPDGRCKTFDAAADGYVRAEGCGIIVLKRLKDALADGDHILALIRGSAVNQDGRSSGLTVPNGPSQQAVIRQALANSGVTADEISYLEAHGTGTSLGDPIEVGALAAVHANREPPLLIGSVKTNIGHLEAAAGIAGLIKVVLMLQHQEIPPHLHFNEPNSHIPWDEWPVKVSTERTAWPLSEPRRVRFLRSDALPSEGSEASEARRLAGVSSFGFSGTNAHLVLEGAPTQPMREQKKEGLKRPLHLLTLSAKSELALRELARRYQNDLPVNPAEYADICLRANTGRAQLEHRLSLIASTKEEAHQKLVMFLEQDRHAADASIEGLFEGYTKDVPQVAFLFTGQGSQYVGMGQHLYESEPTFRATLDHCDEILRSLNVPLLSILYPDRQSSKPPFGKSKNQESQILNHKSQIHETAYTQPALFALEYALAELWRSWGIEPDVVMGHSVGELVAACVAGVFSLEDGLKLVVERGRLMQRTRKGQMVAVLADEARVAALIRPYRRLSMAAINGPENVVISGESASVHRVVALLEREGIRTKKLNVSHAFHSPLMEPILSRFERVASQIGYSAPQMEIISNVTGRLNRDEMSTPAYWTRHIREAVRFAEGMHTLQQQEVDLFIEIGPKPTLLSMGRRLLPDYGSWLPSLRQGHDDWSQLLSTLGQLYVRGVEIDWAGFHSSIQPQRKVMLPTYPFQRERYWIDTSASVGQNVQERSSTPLLELLQQGESQLVASQLETTGELSEEERQLLPKLLDLLAPAAMMRADAINECLYEISWQASNRTASTTDTSCVSTRLSAGSWLIFADQDGVGEALASRLLEQGQSAILVYAADAYKIDRTIIYLNPANPADFERLFAETTFEWPLKQIVHLWGLDVASPDGLTLEEINQALAKGCASVLHLVQSFASQKGLDQARLWVVTRGAVAVGAHEVNVASSPLWGLGKVVALEHPRLWGGLLDLAPSPADPSPNASGGTEFSGVERLLAEIVDSQKEQQIAFRDGQRYVARLVKSPSRTEFSLRTDGSYLITGGLGALGLSVARFLVAQGAKRLVLTGRSGAKSEQAQETVRALSEAGTEVLVVKADVSHDSDVARLLDLCEDLRGIVHAAGVVESSPISEMEWDRFDWMLRPKVRGSWLLHKLSAEIELDFFVMFSSISSVWGSSEQAHYAAANAFLDQLAHYRHQQGRPALSINWGPWSGGGMAEPAIMWLKQRGVSALPPAQAVRALDYLLRANVVQATVAKVDWSRFKRIYESQGAHPLLAAISTPALSSATRSQAGKSELIERLEEGSDREAILMAHLKALVGQTLQLDPSKILKYKGFFEMGMDSLMAVEAKERLERTLGKSLSPTLLFNYPNLSALSEHILSVMGWSANAQSHTPISTTVEVAPQEPIAIIGMSCRVPGAESSEAFWELLANGVDVISEVPPSRWDIDAYYDPTPQPGKMYTRFGGFLEQVDQFDPLFFEISPREAVSLDPQQRLLLEVSWEALEKAGQSNQRLSSSQTGVFVGITANDYGELLLKNNTLPDAYLTTGNALNSAAGRISYGLGLQGPSMAIDTACSSSLVAIHLAVMSLRHAECDMALAGGVNLILSPEGTIALSQARMLSADGRCKTFDESADGYVRGEGCGMVVLKRLSDARQAGDQILAVIRGSAVNQDGASSGLTVPNGLAQQALIRQALKRADVLPSEVSYIEAHGTGTSLGDPIEVEALSEVFANNPLLIGSVKSNVGHLESAAGVTGLIKVVLSLINEQIPPQLHFKEPNSRINWADMALNVPTELTDWHSPSGERIAGVSSFGASGTNAHVLLASAPPEEKIPSSSIERASHLLTLSAKSEEALSALVKRYQVHLAANPFLSLADVCFTANTGRMHFPYRLSLVSDSPKDATQKLTAFAEGHQVSALFSGQRQSTPKIAFLFTGQGSQYVGMGQDLYESEPIFRQTLERCDEILRPLNVPLLSILYPDRQESTPGFGKSQNQESQISNLESQTCADAGSISNLESQIHETAYTQPALFALEYALAELWRSWGIEPDVVMGHSVGELVAACVAGVFSLEDGLKLVAERGRLMQSTKPGEMVAVFADEELLASLLRGSYSDDVSIAAINGPENVLISGESASIRRMVTQLEQLGIRTKKLEVSHAFHSPLMEPILSRFERVAGQIRYAAPQIPIISNVTGDLQSDEMSTPAYWTRHIREAVRFAKGIESLIEEDVELWLEVGPKPTLLGMARRFVANDITMRPSLREGHDDWQELLSTLGQLYVRGIEVEWVAFDHPYQRRKLVLPTYPFQRERYWLDKPHKKRHAARLRPLLDSMMKLPRHQESVFETEFSVENLPFLADHQVFGSVVSPAACHLAMILSGIEVLSGQTACRLTDVLFPAPLVVPDDESRTVQAILRDKTRRPPLTPPNSRGGMESEAELISFTDDEKDEKPLIHATLLWSPLAKNEPASVSLAALQTRCQSEIEPHALMASSTHLLFGPSFRWLERVWVGKEEALAKLRRPETLSLLESEGLHPGLLDACFQTAGATQYRHDSDTIAARAKLETTLPFALGELTFYQAATEAVWWCYAKERGPNKWDIQLLDEQGRSVVDIRGFEVRVASPNAIQQKERWRDWLYKIEWQGRPMDELSPPPSDLTSESWLIFANEEENQEENEEEIAFADEYESGMPAEGLASTIWVKQGSKYGLFSRYGTGTQVTLDPMQTEHYDRLLQDIPNCSKVIYAWGIEQKPLTDVPEQAEQAISGLLHLVQALSRAAWDGELWVVTILSQAVTNNSLSLEQAPLWGLSRTIRAEHPEFTCRSLDLDDRAALLPLLRDLNRHASEHEIAYRQGTRYVARLLRHPLPGQALHREEQSIVAGAAPFHIRLSEYGSPDYLEFQPLARQQPAPNEIEIEIKAVGLNFRDVLNILGMLKTHYAQEYNIQHASELPLGFECAGVVVSVGTQVSQIKIGDRVMALAEGSLASFVTVHAENVAHLPKTMGFEEAATIPMSFLTAYQGLYANARLQAGERVLIHSAAGGVGQAAVQLAQAAGAEVFGTASPSKWAFLKAHGVRHIYNSRTLDFAEGVMRDTAGEGVDVVLNSLTGEFIDKSVSLLAPQARFVEIGKLGIWTSSKMQAQRPDVAYIPFELADQSSEYFSPISSMFAELVSLFDSGQLKPLPHTIFPIQQIGEAVRYMQQAKHTGKVVLSFATPHEETALRPDSSYLITGGLGGLGLQIAQSLADAGAGQLILAGRRAVVSTPEKQIIIDELKERGVTVKLVQADVSQADDVTRLLAACQAVAPLKGIIHAAGVLDDGVLSQQSMERVRAVMKPKVRGAWYLHQLSQEIALDFFICFSSMSSVIATGGQGNYAAANAFLDSLMQERQRMGLPSLSINWGPWAEIGMAAKMSYQQQGLGSIEPEQGPQIFRALLAQIRRTSKHRAQVGVFPVHWPTFLAEHPTIDSFYELLYDQKDDNNSDVRVNGLREQLNTLAIAERDALLMQHLRDMTAKVLGLSSSTQVNPVQGLMDLGLDSLMAVELRNQLTRTLELSLPATLAFDYPTLNLLHSYLIEEMFEASILLDVYDESAMQSEIETEFEPKIDDLNQDELAALLMQEFLKEQD